MSKGTILYVGGFELPDKNAAAQRVIANGKLLRDLGYNVIFCGVSHVNNSFISDKPELYFGFETYSIPYPQNIWGWVKYTLELEKYRYIINNNNIQAVICYNLPSGSLYRLMRLSKEKKFKVISDCTEWYLPPKGVNIVLKIAKIADTYLRMKVLHPKSDGIIAISSFLYNFYLPKNPNVIQVPPLVDANEVKWINESKKEDVDLIRLVYAGSPFSLKDKSSSKDKLDEVIRHLINLKKQGEKFLFNIIGISESQFLTAFPNFKDDLTNNDSFIFFGRIPHQKALIILKESDYSIFVRGDSLVTKAGFPTKFVESISLGIPVLTNKNSNISDYLLEMKNGFYINDKNETEFLKSLKNAFSIDRNILSDMKVYCKQSKTFDYHKYSDRFVKLLG